MARSVRVSLTLAAVVATGFPGCKTITEELPTTASETNNPTVTVPLPAVVTPIALPEPQKPAPTPAPTPGEPQSSPTPAPTDGGGGGNAGQSCAPAPAPGNERCPYEGNSDFIGVVESAYDTLIKAHPDWFNGNGSGATLRISDDKWTWAVINEVRRKGYCAGLYAEEVSVRTSKAYSENFDVVTSAGTIRRGSGSYRSTCYPASTTAE
jgi:hypothetical protein